MASHTSGPTNYQKLRAAGLDHAQAIAALYEFRPGGAVKDLLSVPCDDGQASASAAKEARNG